MLRDLDLNRQDCNVRADDQHVSKIPLTNEHGDVFLRKIDDDCGPINSEDKYEDFPPNQQYYNNQRPLPVESDYFYDQYIDYPVNETVGMAINSTLRRPNNTSPYVDFNQNKFNQNHIQAPIRPPPASQFTFFGHPLPSMTLGNVWGTGRTANNRAASGESTRGKGRVQIFRAGDPELEMIVNQPNELDQDDKNREPAASVKNPIVDSLEKVDEKFYRPYPNFQTPFSQPKSEKGFSPMIPGMTVGGFIPILDPTKNITAEIMKPNDWSSDDDFKEIQLVTKAEPKRTSTKSSSIGQIEKIVSTTVVNHLSTSLSPILSTFVPKLEEITEKSDIGNVMDENSEEVSQEIYARNTNKDKKISFEEELFQQNQPFIPNTETQATKFFSSTTEEALQTGTEPVTTIESFDEADKSSELSADHLIAPGEIFISDFFK